MHFQPLVEQEGDVGAMRWRRVIAQRSWTATLAPSAGVAGADGGLADGDVRVGSRQWKS
jgi:hypothetical protein